MDAILTSGRVEQQSYRNCIGLLKPAEKYSQERLEAACERALSYTGKPSHKSIKNILVNWKEDSSPTSGTGRDIRKNTHGITRGARYYGGKTS